MRRIQDTFAQSADTDGLRPVLVMDESHDLRPEALAMLRLLTNFDMDSRLVLSVVLAGQPPLRTLLARPDQVAMAQRLAHYATLRLLSRDETRAYVVHRCAITGAQTDPFDDDAHAALFEISHGNLRAIDRLALKAIEQAAKNGAGAVAAGDVIQARKGLAP